MQVQKAFLLLYRVQNCNPPVTFTSPNLLQSSKLQPTLRTQLSPCVYVKTQFRSHTPEERESVRRPRDPIFKLRTKPRSRRPAPIHVPVSSPLLPLFSLFFLLSSSLPFSTSSPPSLSNPSQLTFFNHIFLGGGGLCLSLVLVAGGWLELCNCK